MTFQRYAYVRCDGYYDDESLYDIVDHDAVARTTMAHRVRFDAACRIAQALNEQEKLREMSQHWPKAAE